MKKNFESISDIIELAHIPEIQLYMDQVTTFMDDRLVNYKRNQEDKIITKTMINNYTKDKILPPPEKKKYSPSQLMLMIMVFHLKHILSITDIGKLINSEPAKEVDTSLLYDVFTKIQMNEKEILSADLEKMSKKIEELIPAFHLGDNEEMEMLLLVLSLTIDAATKKYIAEKIIDEHIQTVQTNGNGKTKA